MSKGRYFPDTLKGTFNGHRIVLEMVIADSEHATYEYAGLSIRLTLDEALEVVRNDMNEAFLQSWILNMIQERPAPMGIDEFDPEPNAQPPRKTAAEQREEEAERVYQHTMTTVEQAILTLNRICLFEMTHREKDRLLRDLQKDLYALRTKLNNSPYLNKLPF
jgi:hypothetical protein